MKKYFYDQYGNFVIANNCDLKADLEYFLFNKGAIRNPNCNIKYAIDIAENEIKRIVKDLSISELKNFEKYLLECVKLSYIEFTNPKTALRYFLNINSLSIKLSEAEIFYAYMSQLIQVTRSNSINIENLKTTVQALDNKFKKALSEEDIIYLFLKSYFKNDNLISYLGDRKKNSQGIGRWLTGYKMDIISNPETAVDITNKFVDYLSDLQTISTYLVDGNCSKYQNIYLGYLINNYTSNKNTKDILLALFTNRNAYNKNDIQNGEKTFYNKNKQIDVNEIEMFFKLVNATIIKNYIEGAGLIDKLFENTQRKTISAKAILKGLGYKNIFTYTYPTDCESRIKLNNNKDQIHFILALQEAYLNHIANKNLDMNGILYELLDTNKFTIEHLYSKKDFREQAKLDAWQKKGTFTSDYDFDNERSKFENLSLISRNENSSLGANVISKKISSYKIARAIGQTNEPEYLIQSFVDGSDFYNNKEITALGLPKRIIQLNTNNATWDHATTNRDFIETLTKLAVDELFK